jgi:hypothetical protein
LRVTPFRCLGRHAVGLVYHQHVIKEVQLRPDAEEALRAEAERSGRSEQDVIREAVDSYLGLQPKTTGNSDLDDLIARGLVKPPREPYRKAISRIKLLPGMTTEDLLDREDRI